MAWIERTYDVLGATVLVRCAHSACADAIAEHFGPMATEPWTTPDWIVECDLEKAPRELFRSRPSASPGAFDGVRIRGRRMAEPAEWTAVEPPLLPLSAEPLRERLVGLHAASLAIGGDRALLVLGERGAGKTTLALALTTGFDDCALMGDEWTFVLRRTAVALPYPQAVGLWNPVGGKIWRRADAVVERVQLRPRVVTHAIVLEPGGPKSPQDVSPLAAFGLLQQHHLAAGTNHDEAIVTLARLAATVPVTRMNVVAYDEREVAAGLVRALITEEASEASLGPPRPAG